MPEVEPASIGDLGKVIVRARANPEYKAQHLTRFLIRDFFVVLYGCGVCL
jgi:hypothetical protein